MASLFWGEERGGHPFPYRIHAPVSCSHSILIVKVRAIAGTAMTSFGTIFPLPKLITDCAFGVRLRTILTTGARAPINPGISLGRAFPPTTGG